MTPHFYAAYGLTIRSDLCLPEFVPADTGTDIKICLNTPNTTALPDIGASWSFEYEAYTACFAIRQVGVFRVCHGRTITVTPAPDADMDLVRQVLVGTTMGLLLHQRGYLVLHGSAVNIDGAGVAFLGASGAGKSSIAAALTARGHALIADDVAAVDTNMMPLLIAPAFPQLKLSPSVASLLGYDWDSLIPLYDHEPQWGVRHSGDFQQQSVPLRHMYVLDIGERIDIAPLRPNRAMIEFVSHSYPTKLLSAGGPDHFARCSDAAARITTYRLTRPSALDMLPDVAQQVERHVRTVYERALVSI